MKRIVVTGATSMIGTALIDVAVREGVEVYAVVRPNTDRKKRLNTSSLVHTVYGELDSLKEIQGISEKCDVFYHFAWAGTGKATRDDPCVHEQNIRYTLDAVELAEKCGCKRFVGAGSQAEYGPVYDPIDDNTKFSPILSYGIAKYAAGIMGRKLCEKKDIDFVWGRVFSVYGPHDNKGTMLDYAISCFMKGEVAKFSASVHYWNYLFESDAGEMFFLLGKETTPSGTWLIANGESRQLKDYISILMNEYGPEAKAEFAAPTASPIPGLVVDASRTMELFTPRVSFAEGIRKMIREKQTESSDLESKEL